jgi:hypothetical protein
MVLMMLPRSDSSLPRRLPTRAVLEACFLAQGQAIKLLLWEIRETHNIFCARRSRRRIEKLWTLKPPRSKTSGPTTPRHQELPWSLFLLRERQQNYCDGNSRRPTKSFSSKDSEEVRRTLPQTLEPHETTTTRAGLEACFWSGTEKKTTGDGNSLRPTKKAFEARRYRRRRSNELCPKP